MRTLLLWRAWKPRSSSSMPSTAKSAVIADGVPPRADSASKRCTVVSCAWRRAQNARGGRGQEVPALHVGRGGGQGVDQVPVSRPEPGQQFLAVQVGQPGVGMARGVSLGDEPGRPSVHHARVPQQIPHLPARTGRHLGVDPRLFAGRRKQRPFTLDDLDECGSLHGVSVPDRAKSRTPRRALGHAVTSGFRCRPRSADTVIAGRSPHVRYLAHRVPGGSAVDRGGVVGWT